MTIEQPRDVATAAVARGPRPCVCNSPGVAVAHRIAPIFLVRDLAAALAHYRRLGFSVREYAGGGYGYAARENVEIHLGVVPDGAPARRWAYLFVDDAAALANEWRTAGVEVREAEDAEWGQHEGAVVDRDGEVLLRFGSPDVSKILQALGDELGDLGRRRADLDAARPRGRPSWPAPFRTSRR